MTEGGIISGDPDNGATSSAELIAQGKAARHRLGLAKSEAAGVVPVLADGVQVGTVKEVFPDGSARITLSEGGRSAVAAKLATGALMVNQPFLTGGTRAGKSTAQRWDEAQQASLAEDSTPEEQAQRFEVKIDGPVIGGNIAELGAAMAKAVRQETEAAMQRAWDGAGTSGPLFAEPLLPQLTALQEKAALLKSQAENDSRRRAICRDRVEYAPRIEQPDHPLRVAIAYHSDLPAWACRASITREAERCGTDNHRSRNVKLGRFCPYCKPAGELLTLYAEQSARNDGPALKRRVNGHWVEQRAEYEAGLL